MYGTFVTGLTVLLIIVGSCGSSLPSTSAKWSLQLTTSGGFAGVGRGNLSVSSDGKYKHTRSARDVIKGCDSTFTSGQLKPIADAVEKAHPADWSRPGLEVAAADAFGYQLKLRRDGQTFTAKWYDNTSEQLPEDLRNLSEVLLKAMDTSCTIAP